MKIKTKYIRLFDCRNKLDWESESHCITMLKELNDVIYVRNLTYILEHNNASIKPT